MSVIVKYERFHPELDEQIRTLVNGEISGCGQLLIAPFTCDLEFSGIPTERLVRSLAVLGVRVEIRPLDDKEVTDAVDTKGREASHKESDERKATTPVE